MNIEYTGKQITRISDRRLTLEGLAIKRKIAKSLMVRKIVNITTGLFIIAVMAFLYNIDKFTDAQWFSFLIGSIAFITPVMIASSNYERALFIYTEMFNESKSVFVNTSLR